MTSDRSHNAGHSSCHSFLVIGVGALSETVWPQLRAPSSRHAPVWERSQDANHFTGTSLRPCQQQIEPAPGLENASHNARPTKERNT